MTAEELLQAVSDTTFVVIFAVVLARAVRQPRRSAIDATLFFGAVAFLVVTDVIPLVRPHAGLAPTWLTIVRGAVALLLPYLLLRLVDDFAGVPLFVRAGSFLGFIAGAASLFVFPPPYARLHTFLLVAYFVTVQGYNTLRFVQATNACGGMTRARMRAAAIGSGCLALALFLAGAAAMFPQLRAPWAELTAGAGLGCGIGYFLAFAPTRSIRRYWEGPALRAFLSTMIRLPAQSPIADVEDAVETATAAALGAPHALMVLWDEERQRLVAPRFVTDTGPRPARPDTTIAARVYRERRPLAALDAIGSDPENADAYRRFGATAILAAPIIVDADQRCYGVLTAFANRPSVFGEDDLELLVLLAHELGGFLQRRELVLTASALEAREEATRLKDEFLSAAAHDLRTPLTIVVAQAQLLQRHLRTRPDAADANIEEADRLVGETQRMWRMTEHVLDASRLDASGFIGECRPTNLVALAHDVAATVDSPRHVVQVDGAAVVAAVDAERMRQVLQNLLDNAVKFSPAGGKIIVGLRCIADEVEIRVSDPGIGIPAPELQHVFERFYRGGAGSERGFGGMGIGLFLCKRIVEEHGGRIWAESRRGHGSEFFVQLPAIREAQVEPTNGAAHSHR